MQPIQPMQGVGAASGSPEVARLLDGVYSNQPFPRRLGMDATSRCAKARRQSQRVSYTAGSAGSSAHIVVSPQRWSGVTIDTVARNNDKKNRLDMKERMTLALRSPFDHWMSSVAFHVAYLAHCASPLGIR